MKIQMKAIAILLSLVVLSGIAVASACSTRTPGYWKNHYPQAWPTSATITYTDPDPALLGMPEYYGSWTLPGGSLSNALAILQMPVKGDAKINLQQKVIAAELSIAVDQRDGWAFPPNYNVAQVSQTLPGLIDQAVALLNSNSPYNSAKWTPGSVADTHGIRAQGLALAGAIDGWLNYFDEAPII
jgi:hypothetical protein